MLSFLCVQDAIPSFHVIPTPFSQPFTFERSDKVKWLFVQFLARSTPLCVFHEKEVEGQQTFFRSCIYDGRARTCNSRRQPLPHRRSDGDLPYRMFFLEWFESLTIELTIRCSCVLTTLYEKRAKKRKVRRKKTDAGKMDRISIHNLIQWHETCSPVKIFLSLCNRYLCDHHLFLVPLWISFGKYPFIWKKVPSPPYINSQNTILLAEIRYQWSCESLRWVSYKRRKASMTLISGK